MRRSTQLHETESDARELYAASLGALARKRALERTGVMGGTNDDTPLHERQGTAVVAELAAPINPDLSLIPRIAYVPES